MCRISLGKAILALVAHLIDKDFKLHELLVFAKHFSDVAHSGVEIEKAIKTGLCEFGVGLYDTTKTPIVDTVSKHELFYVLSCVVFYMPIGFYAYRLQHVLWELHLIKQVQ